MAEAVVRRITGGGTSEAAASVRGCRAGLTRRSRSALQPAIYRGAP